MLNIILFGPPGSGKGTQAKKLAKKFELLHISTGDLFRYELGNNTELGKLAKSYMDKGEFVPDDVTNAMLKSKVEKHLDAKGFILDGFPRNEYQAQFLDDFLGEIDSEITLLFSLSVPDDEVVSRILERGKTSGRSDDQDESIIRNRIAKYKKDTAPVYAYYDAFDKSIQVNGVGSIDNVFSELCTIVESFLEQN